MKRKSAVMTKPSGDGRWYCHVQRDFRPYSAKINEAIERDYRAYLKGGSTTSAAFDLPSGNYQVNFEREGSADFFPKALSKMGIVSDSLDELRG